ncbi:ExbD/TolR family protein [Prevotella sp. OH937_COT-195]|uniref:ExbD/TolR family protein n=1 Tax=Prevotella sp. OH937_COT-195 TaxID=2491051 RepID=UPI000F64B22C|nr:biopolymer transporter ExbD [Prevotella sp. OH937_COT-195]RRC97652.1 biopolymer transporter ExbD [Prevotella sp. OH937_COT-195]
MPSFKRRREIPSLNTTSTADISFMLLILFLVTTSLDADKGLQRQLPPMDNRQDIQIEVNSKNILRIELTADNGIMIDDKPSSTSQLRSVVTNFVTTSPDRARHIISLKTDRAATYAAYFKIQNEIVAAYQSLRDNAARKYYHRPYARCSGEQREKLRELYPQRIAEGYVESEEQPEKQSPEITSQSK